GVAAASTLLTAIYPVFFAQSSLAQVDLPAAGMIFWGLESYVRRRRGAAVMWFSLAAWAKETAILAPLALFFWFSFVYLSALCGSRFLKPPRTRGSTKEFPSLFMTLLLLLLPLPAWFPFDSTL